MTTDKKLPPTLFYGVERCNSYDLPQTRIKLFRNLANAQKWFDIPPRDAYKDEKHFYPFYKIVYRMPWYYRFPLVWKMDAWLEENKPSRKDWWSLDDIRGDIVKNCGLPEKMV